MLDCLELARVQSRDKVQVYSAVGYSEQSEEHIFVSPRSNLGHHGLRVRVIWRLEQSKQNIVDPATTLAW